MNFLLPQTSWFLVINSFLLGSSLLLDLFPGHEEMLKFDQLSFGVTKVESLSFGDIQDGPSSFVTFNTSLLLPSSSGILLSRLIVKFSFKLEMRRDTNKREAGESGTWQIICPSLLVDLGSLGFVGQLGVFTWVLWVNQGPLGLFRSIKGH